MIKYPKLDGPLSISWDVTNSCNFRCMHCFNRSGDSSYHNLTSKLFQIKIYHLNYFVHSNMKYNFNKISKENTNMFLSTNCQDYTFINLFNLFLFFNSSSFDNCYMYNWLNKKPEINASFGFRTKASMSCPEAWKLANTIGFIFIMVLSFIFLILNIVFTLLAYYCLIPYFVTYINLSIYMISLVVLVIAVDIFISIKFRSKLKQNKTKCELIENEKSKKQDIDDFWN